MPMKTLLRTAVGTFVASLGIALFTEVLLKDRITIIGSFIGLQKSHNEGIAFGIELGPGQDFIIILALIAVVFIGVRYAKTRLEQAGFGLIVGGGAANLVDRILDGVVTDMIQVGTFPIFNIADTCINIGIVSIIFASLWEGKVHKPPKKASAKQS